MILRVFSNINIALILWVWILGWNNYAQLWVMSSWWDIRGARAGISTDLTLSISLNPHELGKCGNGEFQSGTEQYKRKQMLFHQCLCPPDPKVHKALKPFSIRAPKTHSAREMELLFVLLLAPCTLVEAL